MGVGIRAAMPAFARLVRRDWEWLLVLSCVPLLATKTLFNLPVAVMALIGIARLVRHPRRYGSDPVLRLLVLLFFCFWIPMWLSLPDAVDFRRSLSTTLAWLRFPLAAVFIRDVLREEAARRRLLWGTGIVIAAWSLDAIVQLVAGVDLFGYPYNGERLTGIFHPKLRLGTVTAAFLPVYFAWARVATRTKRWLWVPLLVPALAAVLLSGSRTAWIMLAVGLTVYGIHRLSVSAPMAALKRAGVLLVVLGIMAVAVLGHEPFRHRVGVTLGLVTGSWKLADEATSGRLSIWATALNMARAHWLNGVGPRGFRKPYLTHAHPRDALAAEGTVPTHPHQFVLEVLAETGVVGLMGYIAFWWVLFARTGGAFRHRGAAGAWLAAVVVAAFPLNVHMSLYASYWSTVLWWLLSVGVAVTDPVLARKKAAPS